MRHTPAMRKFLRRQQLGQGMTEYIIIVALIAIAAIGVFSAFGNTAKDQVAAMALELSGKNGATQVTAAGADSTKADTAGKAKTNLGNYGNQVQYGK